MEPPVDTFHNTPTSGQGIYFDEQWERALEVSPQFIWVTGWNEWIAQRFVADKDAQFGGQFAGLPQKKGDSFFVDAFSDRVLARRRADAQLDRRQLLLPTGRQHIRRYKGARPLPIVRSAPIQIDGQFADWNAVSTEFRDTRDDEVRRDSVGWKGYNYQNQSGRNDIVSAKIELRSKQRLLSGANARGADQTERRQLDAALYRRRSRTRKPVGWATISSSTAGDVAAGKTTIRANIGGQYQWGAPRTIPLAMRDNQLELSIPRWILGANSLDFDFKWADNCHDKGDWTDFTLNGDAAPNDRFNYRFKIGN